MPDWKPRDTQRARDLRKAATPPERHLWRYLSRGQLDAKFSRQMQLGPYFADFLCRELMLVFECDGFSHDMRPVHDEARDRWMRAEGYTVLRFSNVDVLGNTEGVVEVWLSRGPFRMTARLDESTDRFGRELRIVKRINPDGSEDRLADFIRAEGGREGILGVVVGGGVEGSRSAMIKL